MSKKKKLYELTINNLQDADVTYIYEYNNVKHIQLCIGSDGVKIIVLTGADITADMILSNQNPLFVYSINKSILLYTIRYSKALNIEDFSFSIDGIDHMYRNTEFPICSIIENQLICSFSERWKNVAVTDYILNYKERYKKPTDAVNPDLIKKESPRLMAALVALITAKSKKFEYERFQFLWMSMNGLYGYVSHLYEPSGKKERIGEKKRLSEVDEMSILWQCLDWNNEGNKWCILNRDKPIIASKVIKILGAIDCNLSIDDLKKVLFEGAVAEKIESQIHTYPKERYDSEQYNISSRQYIIFFLPYYIRCKYFHADTPFPLLAKKNDAVIHTLRIVNKILESFLQEQLPLWMERNTLPNEIICRFNTIMYGSSPT